MLDSDTSTAPSRLVRDFVLAALGYTALTLLLFHGLFGRFSTAVPHDLGDPLLSTSVLWWNAHVLPFVGKWWDGLSFFPGPGSLAFSDHRVGLAPIASPIQWLGGTPILAYNVTLLACFVLSALSAHALTWMLTRSHAAGAVSGLIFGFNPFRISHVAHLELLAVYWLPLAFMALHMYAKRYETRWLVLFAGFWLLQGLSSGYYLFYSAPVIVLWTFWFAHEHLKRSLVSVGLACAAVFVALSPVFLQYQRIQNQLLLSRGYGEIEFFSADVTGLVSATPIMALWRFRSLATNGEAEIYLGIFAPLLVLAAALFTRRAGDAGEAPPASRWPLWRRLVAIVGGIYALIAASALFGGWSIQLGPLTVSATQAERPLTYVAAALAILAASSPRVARFVRRRTPFGFYVTAAVMTWLFTLGPRPKFLGHPLFRRGLYSLLMLLPGYDERLRVPARFVMMTIFAVSIAAGIALVRLTARSTRTMKVAVTVFLLLAITADSWTFELAVPIAPPLIELPSEVPASAAVLELPLGNVGPDITAVYRTIGHGRPVVNGYSGYEPPHYRVVRYGLEARDHSLLSHLTSIAPLAIIVTKDDPGGNWTAFVEEHPGAVRLRQTDDYTLYLLPATAPDEPSLGTPLTPVSAIVSSGQIDLSKLTDGDPETIWRTPGPQQGNEKIAFELPDVRQVAGVSLSLGRTPQDFPRELVIDVSLDGIHWDPVWRGGTAGAALAGVLRDPRITECRFAFPAVPARYVRLRSLRGHYASGWTIAEMRVHEAKRSSP